MAFAKPMSSAESISRMPHMTNPAEDLYDLEWNTLKAHPYKEDLAPTKFTVDLRGFTMPIDRNELTSKYGYRKQFKRQHKGVDIKAYRSDTIRSSFDGKVRVINTDPSGYGRYIVVRHSNGLETIYGHLSKWLVKDGQWVKAGDPIGIAGSTGKSTGTHLHFEIRLCGVPIDPEQLIDFIDGYQTRDYWIFER